VPVLAVIASIRALHKDSQILFVCSGKPNEIALLEANNIDYKIVPSGKYRRYGRGFLHEITDLKTQFQNIADVPRVARGYSYSRKIIRQFKPDVVFIKGGYVGLPVGMAATRAGVPIVLHESDIVMGKANSRLAKSAAAVAVSFPTSSYETKFKDKLKYIGNPVRPEFYPSSDSKPNKINKQKPNILIFAGSQGAEAINNNVFENLELYCKSFNLLHITGEQGIERARYMQHKLPRELKEFYQPFDFLTKDMIAAYNWADLVISRGGMNSLSEIAALSKPSIIIPLPSSTNNHQYKNAEFLAKQGAVRMLVQDKINGLGLINEISRLVDDQQAVQYLSETVHKFFNPKASLDLARLILASAKREVR